MAISKKHTLVRLLAALLVLGVLAFLGVGCKAAVPANGTVTVSLFGATVQANELFIFAVFKESADWQVPDEPDGLGTAVITVLGEAQDTARDLDYIAVVSFTGGGKYYVAAIIDMDGSSIADPNNTITNGDFIYIGDVFTVDGNVSQTLDFTLFTLVDWLP